MKRVGLIAATIILLVVNLGPIVWLGLSSFKSTKDIISGPTDLFFTPTLENFVGVIKSPDFLEGLILSLTVAIAVTCLGLSAGICLSYLASRLKRRWRVALDLLAAFGYVFPPILVAFPLFVVISAFGEAGTFFTLCFAHLCLVFPACFLLIRSRIDEIPRQVEEILLLDGADTLSLLAHVWLPSLKFSLLAVGTIIFVISVGDYVMARFLLTGSDMTLPLVLQQMIDLSYSDWGVICASGALSFTLLTIPLLIITFFSGSFHTGGRRR